VSIRDAQVAGRDTPELQSATLAPPLPLRLLAIVRRRWRVVSAVVAATLIAAVIATMLMTPKYLAETRLQIAREGDRVIAIQGVQRESDSADLEFYQTQYGLLNAASLARRVADALKLTDSEAFFKMFDASERKTGAFNAPPTPAQRAERERLASEILLDNVTIAPIRGSSLVDVRFISPDAQLSAQVANAWADKFITVNLERRLNASGYARRALESRLATLRQRLEQSERQLVNYGADQNISSLPGSVDRNTGTVLGERSIIADQLARLNESLADAVADRIKAQSEQGIGSQGASERALGNATISGLRERRGQLAADYAKLMQQFDPEYPSAKALQTQIASLDASIAREVSRVSGSYGGAYGAALNRERGLREQVSKLEGQDTDLRRRSIQFNIFKREVDTNRQLYDALLQRYKEIGVAGGIGTNNIAVVDEAEVPDRPYRPSWKINLGVGLLAGLLLGLIVAWVMERVDEGISDPAEVQSTLNLPLLGTVPKVEGESLLVELANRKSAMVEAYLAVQASLELATANGFARSISVTSTRPREGKSTTSYALAHSLARGGRRVVLVDGDMRAPMVHNEFGLPNDMGLSNLLSGTADLSTTVQKTTIQNLSVMTSGAQPPNAAELLSGLRFRQVIADLLTHYDNVVVDSPPVMGLADAALIANSVEGTVFTVEARSVRSGNIRVALNRLYAANANIFGVVLTKFDGSAADSSYGYDYGYRYGEPR
jgi:capsular exopolysaccharide synthesis family protein